MNSLNLLIVEDDPAAIDSYKRDINSYNLTNEVKINADFKSDKDQAIDILNDNTKYFDAAIVDLKLDSGGIPDENYTGNDVLKKIKGKLRFPVFVITGTPEHLDTSLKEQNSFFKLKIRGEESNYLQELCEIYETGITNVLGRKGAIEKYLNEIFWNHLSSSIDVWIRDNGRQHEEREKALLRYTLLHMQEYIDEEIEKYHPNEFYITPPVKSELYTGDIIEYKDQKCLALTPACDFSQKNADYVLFVNIKDWETLDAEFKKRPLSGSKEQRLKSLITNKTPRYHFIPQVGSFKGAFIDFQDKSTIPTAIVENRIAKGDAKRIATVSGPFLKDIIARYSSYFSRQGSPDFNTEEIYSALF